MWAYPDSLTKYQMHVDALRLLPFDGPAAHVDQRGGTKRLSIWLRSLACRDGGLLQVSPGSAVAF